MTVNYSTVGTEEMWKNKLRCILEIDLMRLAIVWMWGKRRRKNQG